MPSTSFLPISGNIHLSPGEIQTHRDEEFRTCLSLLFIFRTLDGSWQTVRERAHAHPRARQVPQLPLGVQSAARREVQATCSTSPGLTSSCDTCRGVWALAQRAEALRRRATLQVDGCCWSPPFSEGSGKDISCSPLLVVHNSRWQLMGESLSNYSRLRTYITEVRLGNLLGESLLGYSHLRVHVPRVSLGNLPRMIFS